MMLFKILILHSVAEVQQDEGEIPQAFQASLIEILGNFLNGTLSALNKLEQIAEQKDCYCGDPSTENTVECDKC